MPKYSHAFHFPCIDAWLRLQSNCPLCRAAVVTAATAHHMPPNVAQTSSDLRVNSYQIRLPDDLVLVVVNDREDERRAVICHDDDDVGGGNAGCVNTANSDQFRKSVSLGTFSSQRRLLISDVLKLEDIDERADHLSSSRGIGSSRGLLRRPVAANAICRSISTDGFLFTVHNKGKNSALPN